MSNKAIFLYKHTACHYFDYHTHNQAIEPEISLICCLRVSSINRTIYGWILTVQVLGNDRSFCGNSSRHDWWIVQSYLDE